MSSRKGEAWRTRNRHPGTPPVKERETGEESLTVTGKEPRERSGSNADHRSHRMGKGLSTRRGRSTGARAAEG